MNMLLNTKTSGKCLIVGVAAAGLVTLSGCSMIGSFTKPEQAVPASSSASASPAEVTITPVGESKVPVPTQNAGKNLSDEKAAAGTTKAQKVEQPVQTPVTQQTPDSNKAQTALEIKKQEQKEETATKAEATPPTSVKAELPKAPERNIAPSSISRELNGEWVITSVGSQAIKRDDSMPYLTFDAAAGRFYSSNGCNILNGSYSVTENRITFSNVLSTMKYCADVDFDTAINNVIRDGNTVVGMVKRIATDTYLYLNDSSGKALMTLVHHNMSFLNGQWQVINVNSQPVNDEEANIFFDIPSLKIHGNTGCNYFNGSILIDPAVPGSISFSGMAVTRMACPKGDQERTMLVALEETVSAIADGKDHVLLIDEAGNPVIRLKRIQATDD